MVHSRPPEEIEPDNPYEFRIPTHTVSKEEQDAVDNLIPATYDVAIPDELLQVHA